MCEGRQGVTSPVVTERRNRNHKYFGNPETSMPANAPEYKHLEKELQSLKQEIKMFDNAISPEAAAKKLLAYFKSQGIDPIMEESNPWKPKGNCCLG
ncbi:hypothetical protein AAMO2058_000614600 [Amorphochlora amoebiformis]